MKLVTKLFIFTFSSFTIIKNVIPQIVDIPSHMLFGLKRIPDNNIVIMGTESWCLCDNTYCRSADLQNDLWRFELCNVLKDIEINCQCRDPQGTMGKCSCNSGRNPYICESKRCHYKGYILDYLEPTDARRSIWKKDTRIC